MIAGGGILLQVALAQDAGFDGHGLALAPQTGDPRAPLVVQQPSAFRAGDAFFTGLAEYARVDAVAIGGKDVVLRDLVALNLSAGVAVLDRWRLDVRAPLFGWTSGSGGSAAPTIGDVRLTSMWTVARPGRAGVGLGAVAHVDAPTGAEARYLGQPGWAAGGRLALSLASGPVTLATDAGLHLRTPRAEGAPLTEPGDQLVAGAALSFGLGERVGLTVEGTTSTELARFSGDSAAILTAEGLASIRIVPRSGPFVTLGAGAGLLPGTGTPRYRTFVGIGLARRRSLAPPDTDPLFPLESSDLCPLELEVDNGWRDDDGCPDRLGTLSVDVRFEGESRPATAEIIGPERTREQRIGPQGLSLDVMPGTTWTIRAAEGCLRGEAEAEAREEGATVVVELAPVQDAGVLLQVVDREGRPVPDAEIGWRSEEPDCVPRTPAPVDADGRLSQQLASGLHTLVVTAPRYHVYDQLVSLLPGAVETLAVTLEPSPVFVEGDEIRVLEKIHFASGRATLLERSFGVLDELADLLLASPELARIEVAGHTDSKGSDDLNLRLSQQRAAAVRDYLVGRGVDPGRLVAVGHGETHPVASNRTEEGREANRRVTFRVLPPEAP